MWFISWLFLEFIFSAPDFYLIKGEKDCKFTLTYFREGRWRAG